MSDFNSLKQSLTSRGVSLVAVSKTKPIDALMRVYDQGQRIFGENRVNELREKQPAMPGDIEWHMIGHLQTKKVKYIAPFISMIHSIDTPKLLMTVNEQAEKNNRIIDVLLQFKIASEDSKYGLSFETFGNEASADMLSQLKNVRIRGVMGMATFTDDEEVVRAEFQTLKSYFDQLQNSQFKGHDAFDTISMGMSGDYEIAIEEGSTMVRIGSLIFGPRA